MLNEDLVWLKSAFRSTLWQLIVQSYEASAKMHYERSLRVVCKILFDIRQFNRQFF